MSNDLAGGAGNVAKLTKRVEASPDEHKSVILDEFVMDRLGIRPLMLPIIRNGLCEISEVERLFLPLQNRIRPIARGPRIHFSPGSKSDFAERTSHEIPRKRKVVLCHCVGYFRSFG